MRALHFAEDAYEDELEELSFRNWFVEKLNSEKLDYLRDLIDQLENKEIRYVLLHKLKGESFGKIGKKIGFTRQRAHQLMDKGINQLRSKYNKNRQCGKYEEKSHFHFFGKHRNER